MAGRSRFRAWAAEPRFAGEAYRHATGGGRTKEVKRGGDGADEWARPKGVEGPREGQHGHFPQKSTLAR